MVVTLLLAGLASCTTEAPDIAHGGVPAQSAGSTVTRLSYEVVGRYPHDPTAFVQGLLWHGGGFYESTGLHGRSTVRRVAFPSGQVLQSHRLPDADFGEGLALVGDQLIQLTWQSRRGYRYDRTTLTRRGEFTYPAEGWGLTYDGTYLIASDGSPMLTYLDPTTVRPVRHLAVTFDGRPLSQLNELEYLDGQIWANVWHQDFIVAINPKTGRVSALLDLTGLRPRGQVHNPEAVLNGIAYDPVTQRFFVTGKLWPTLFALRITTSTPGHEKPE
jgi:glutamine cyclotransferase